MTQETVIYLAREALSVVLLVAAPMLGIGMLVGIIVSILQATTQIQEQTLTFVPKIIAVMTAIILFGPWMLTVITQFTHNLFYELPKFIY
ncbi:MAG: flagellar biosynthesis protein FliQ [Thermoanaerobacteraceae bacterium]|nr:flagellar biosynthesis protein FliQ [Thermoanaerobacteraceae bacterium]